MENNKRALRTVTLLGIDCVDIDRLILAANICEEEFEFGEVKLLTSLETSNDSRIVKIPHIGSVEEYSRFCIEELDKYVDTSHVLIFQYDGFILNPKAWDYEFLNYDYIGAPWHVNDWSVDTFSIPKEYIGKLLVGNGGFNIRSKKLTSLCAQLAREKFFKKYHPEDVVLCVDDREYLEKRGIVFAPTKLAKKFSFEGENDESKIWNGEFGFHGLRWTDISNWLESHPEYKKIFEEKYSLFRQKC